MPAPPDYEERVYAGVLGKTIGIYLGQTFSHPKWYKLAPPEHAACVRKNGPYVDG